MSMFSFCMFIVVVTFTNDSYQFSEDSGVGYVVVSKSVEVFSDFSVIIIGDKPHSTNSKAISNG